MSFARNQGFLEFFHAGSIIHVVVLAALFIGNALLALAGQSAQRRSEFAERRLGRGLAVLFFVSWLAGFLREFQPDRLGWEHSLPLHLCDILGLIAPLALLTGRRIFRTLLYFGGLGLSSQAFLTPVLHCGPLHSDFWLYWITHGAIVSAAIYDLSVKQFRPTWQDWQWTIALSACYVLFIIPIDVIMHVNYGYLGNTEHAERSLVMAFGSWPARVPRLILTAWSLMAIMTLPWITYRLPEHLRSPFIDRHRSPAR